MADGILIIDKPTDYTSMDVCAVLRGIYREKKVGHAGTLDPMATGVLPVFLGKATKAVSFAECGEKTYEAVLKLGVVTDTQDRTGTVLKTAPVPDRIENFESVLEQFRGDILQIPPMYSAIKVKGRKLYDIARRGETVERAPRPVTIRELTLLGQVAPACYALRIVCSKGTYIRTLCHDIGEALGCGGTMESLRRTAAAGFTLADAVTLETAQERRDALLLPLDAYFRDRPAYTLRDAETERRVRCGNPFSADVPDGTYRIYGIAGDFLALSRAEGGLLTSVKNFF